MIINNNGKLVKIKNFSINEFPEDPVKFADPKLIINLDRLREFIGSAINISPVKGALARFDINAKNSQHYAVGRKSTAIDIFIDCDPFEAFVKILQSKLFNRAGFYPNWKYKDKITGGFHLDLKDQNLMWYRDNGEYYYSYQKNFYSNLLDKMKNG